MKVVKGLQKFCPILKFNMKWKKSLYSTLLLKYLLVYTLSKINTKVLYKANSELKVVTLIIIAIQLY